MDAACVPGNLKVWDMICDIGSEERSVNALHFRELARDIVETTLPFPRKRLVVFVEIKLERLDHPDDLFLADFLAAAERVFVRAVIQQGAGDHVRASDQQAGTLRASNGFRSEEHTSEL